MKKKIIKTKTKTTTKTKKIKKVKVVEVPQSEDSNKHSVTLNLNGQEYTGTGLTVIECLNQIAEQAYTKSFKTKAVFTSAGKSKVIFNRMLIRRFFERPTYREFFAKRLM